MSPAPDFTPLGERFHERVEPIQPLARDANYGYAFANLCEGMMRPYAQVAELVDPEDPYEPWTPLFYLDITPDWALPWVGQIVGVPIPATATPEEARRLIREQSFQDIGKPKAIADALRPTLTGAQTIWMRERDGGDPYRLEIVTLVSETPDPAASLAALEPQIPAGIVLSFVQVEGWDYQQMETEGGDYTGLDTTFDEYSEMSRNVRD